MIMEWTKIWECIWRATTCFSHKSKYKITLNQIGREFLKLGKTSPFLSCGNKFGSFQLILLRRLIYVWGEQIFWIISGDTLKRWSCRLARRKKDGCVVWRRKKYGCVVWREKTWSCCLARKKMVLSFGEKKRWSCRLASTGCEQIMLFPPFLTDCRFFLEAKPPLCQPAEPHL